MNRSDAGKKGYEKTKKAIKTHRERQKRAAREKYEENLPICPNCDAVIPFEKRRNKFCSHSCAASYNNRGQVRVETVNPVECAHCGAVKETRQNKYCDECNDNRVYNKITKLEDANSDFTRKRILIEQRGHQCESCGLSEWFGQEIMLELHHVDGNSDNSEESNLKILCPNCHSQTDFYKGAGKGNNSARYSARRIKRRKRYNDGKTW